MSSIYLILNWVAGLFFALLGLLVFFSGAFLAGIPLIILSLLLLPPTQKIITEKTKKTLSIKAKTISTLVLFIVSMTFLAMHDEAEKAAAGRTIINEFTQNKQQIIASIEKNFEIKSYQTVINEIDKYSIVNDKYLKQLRAKAEIGLKVRQVLSRLEKLPEDNAQGKVRNYQELVILAPDNQNYKDQLAHFKKVAEAQRLAQIEKELKEKESKLLSVLEELPEDNTQGQIKSYQALLKLAPDNQKYKDKLAHFEKIAKAQHLAQIEKELREKESKLLSELESLPEDNTQGQIKSYQVLVKLLPDNQGYQDKLTHFEKVAEVQRLAQMEKDLREKESKLLSKLEGLPEENTQGQIKSYQALVNLLPDNQGYKDKLAHFENIAEIQRLADIKQENEKKEKEILAHLKTLKKDDAQGNINAYKQLTELLPNNEKYKKKLIALNKADNEKRLFEYMKKAWNVYEYTSEKNDSTNVNMHVTTISNLYEYRGKVIKPELNILCRENTTSVYVNWGVYLGVRNKKMEYRIESHKSAKTRTFSVTTDYKALGYFSGGKAIPFIKSLFDEGSVTMWVTPNGESTMKAKFEIVGLDMAIAPLRKACHW